MAIERIGGLRALRQQQEMEEIEAQMRAEAAFHEEMWEDACSLSSQLSDKYGKRSHPLWPIEDWKKSVDQDVTLLGYWDWVLYRLNE